MMAGHFKENEMRHGALRDAAIRFSVHMAVSCEVMLVYVG